MTEEKEILTILTKEEHEDVLARLKKEFGEPEISKRLALQCTNYRWIDIDTRIRIANGKAEIIQKVGNWEDDTRNEITVSLPSDAQVIFDMYTILRNAIRDEEVLTPIIQFENRLFKTSDFEIKLTYQFGKRDAYNCEVEVFDSKLEPKEIAEKFDIPIHLPEQSPDFWKKWNKTVNLASTELTDTELLKIIKSYL